MVGGDVVLQTDAISKQYGEKLILEDVSFSINEGEVFGIIGPNGSGKSTLLKQLSGVEKPSKGHIHLAGKDIESYSRKDIAKWVAVLQQEALPTIGFTVKEVIEMGRFPFQNWLGEDKVDVEALIDSILEKMNLTTLSDRKLEQLSGGERQRVALAKTMAQSPTLLILDEPTTYLDIGHQIHLMDRIQHWKMEDDMTVIAVLHDLNLAALYCDRILLLHDGKVVASGTPHDIIQEKLIEEVYGVQPIIISHPENGLPQILLESEHQLSTNFSATRKTLEI